MTFLYNHPNKQSFDDTFICGRCISTLSCCHNLCEIVPPFTKNNEYTTNTTLQPQEVLEWSEHSEVLTTPKTSCQAKATSNSTYSPFAFLGTEASASLDSKCLWPVYTHTGMLVYGTLTLLTHTHTGVIVKIFCGLYCLDEATWTIVSFV